MKKNVVTATAGNFRHEVIESPVPVLVDFWAPWCAPCRMIAPIVDEIAREYAGRVKVAKLNTDENVEVAQEYGIRGIPTLGIFVGGEMVDSIVGLMPGATIRKKLESVLAANIAN